MRPMIDTGLGCRLMPLVLKKTTVNTTNTE